MVDLRAKPKSRKERLQRLIGDIRDGIHAYEPRPTKARDWGSYEEAQSHELADTLELIHRLLLRIREPIAKKARGRPAIVSTKDKAKFILLRQAFQVSNRVGTGHARIFKEKLRLENTPRYKTIERAYENPEVFSVLAQLFDETLKIAAGNTTGYTIDGSGISTTLKGNWERDKSESSENADCFDGSVAMVCLPTQVVSAYVPRAIGFTSEVDTLPRFGAENV